MKLTVVASLLCLQVVGVFCINTTTTSTTLHLLALVPLGNEDQEDINCLDLGEQMISAANLAAQRINENPEFFKDPAVRLEIIPSNINRCSDPSIATSLASIANASNTTTNGDANIVGIIGLVCPSSLLSLSPLASLPEIRKLQISSSTTPPSLVAASRKESVGLLYQIAPSTSTFNKAVLAMMKSMAWKEISVIRHTDLYSVSVEHDNLASDFQMQSIGANISSNHAETASGIDQFIQTAKARGIRLIYTSVTISEARELLCKSHRAGLSWPNYLWIFYDHFLEELLHNTTECSLQTMQEAAEGIMLLYHDISENPDRAIDYANYTYDEYLMQYSASIGSSTTRLKCNTKPRILSANALHDSVLAFAYALNRTLPETGVGCLDELACNATNATFNSYLQSVDFMGAGGPINFNSTTHELTSDSRINIFQVLNGALSSLGHFKGSLILNASRELLSFNSTFPRVIVRLHLALPVVTLVVDILCLALTIVVMILFTYYRESPDIKATSPLLSYIILFSCILLYLSVGMTAIRHIFSSGQAFAALCASEEVFFVLGVQLIFATLCIRLFRVSRIFFNLDPVGTAWSDRYLALYIGITVIITVILLVFWIAFGDFSVGEEETFMPDAKPPVYSISLSCNAEHSPIFLTLIFGYIVIFMAIVVILAIKTRKVRIDVFRDTKSVSAFVFCSVGILSLFIPLSFITASISGLTYLILSYLFKVTSLLAVAVACICFLYIPKIFVARTYVNRPRSKSRSSTCYKSEEGFRSSAYGRKNSRYE